MCFIIRIIQICICINIQLLLKLPQLVPFFFVNQVIFAFVLLVVLVYGFSKYILPKSIVLFLGRISLTKL